jgi:hypothetical protein
VFGDSVILHGNEKTPRTFKSLFILFQEKVWIVPLGCLCTKIFFSLFILITCSGLSLKINNTFWDDSDRVKIRRKYCNCSYISHAACCALETVFSQRKPIWDLLPLF